jgi:hypothetical protein
VTRAASGFGGDANVAVFGGGSKMRQPFFVHADEDCSLKETDTEPDRFEFRSYLG